MRVVIANFGPPTAARVNFREAWAHHEMPPPGPRIALFDQPVGWGFHICALGVYLRDVGLARTVEFWNYGAQRSARYMPSGVLRLVFWNADDVEGYLDRYGPPDLFINYGRHGRSVLQRLAGRSFRVHVPCLRHSPEDTNADAECYLVDAEEYLGERAMLYVPVVNTRKIAPRGTRRERDWVYLAAFYPGKRHDLLLDAVRGSALTGHLHPVDGRRLDLTGTRITTSNWDGRDVVELLETSRIAVYPADETSNPAAMWECVAAGLPIVVNAAIRGGKHLVVPGMTGELASPAAFGATLRRVLACHHAYRAREYFEATWDTVATLDTYLAFFRRMGWGG